MGDPGVDYRRPLCVGDLKDRAIAVTAITLTNGIWDYILFISIAWEVVVMAQKIQTLLGVLVSFLATASVAQAQSSTSRFGDNVCPNQMELGAEYSLTHSDVYSAKYFSLVAGGSLDLSRCPNVPGVGYIISKPDFSIRYMAKPGQRLKVNVNARCDTVLLINSPTNEWHWNDDTNGVDPEIWLTHSVNGYYDIWVGTITTANCDAEVRLESFE